MTVQERRYNALLALKTMWQKAQDGKATGKMRLMGFHPLNNDDQEREAVVTMGTMDAVLKMAKHLGWIDGGVYMDTGEERKDEGGLSLEYGLSRDNDNPGGALKPLPDAVLTLLQGLESVKFLPPADKHDERAEAEQGGGYLSPRNQADPADEVYAAKVWLRIFQRNGFVDPTYVIAEETHDGETRFFVSDGKGRMTPGRYHAERDGR